MLALTYAADFLLIGAGYLRLVPAQHKSGGLKDFKKSVFKGVGGWRRIKQGGSQGSRQDEKKLGAHRNAKEVAPFFSPLLPSRSGVGSSQLRHFINSCYLTRGIVAGASSAPFTLQPTTVPSVTDNPPGGGATASGVHAANRATGSRTSPFKSSAFICHPWFLPSIHISSHGPLRGGWG